MSVSRLSLQGNREYPSRASIVVVNDGSTDKTGEAARTKDVDSLDHSSISFTRAIYYMFKVSYAIMMEMFRTRKVESQVTV